MKLKIRKNLALIDQHDKNFMYGGKFGGNFIPETLKKPIDDLTQLFQRLRNDPNLFGGYGVQILPRVSIASSWNGNALNAGFGLSPFDFPLNFSIGISDITNNSNNGAQFNINTGYSFRF